MWLHMIKFWTPLFWRLYLHTKRDKTNISTQMLTSRVNNAKVMISQTSPAILLKKFKTCDDAIGSEQSYFGVNYVL